VRRQLKAFLASPFAQEYRWIRNAAAKACRELNVDLRVIDEVVTPGADIISAIHQEIESADLAFAVLTGYNPNVMYELGRLLQASKPTILIIEKGSFSTMPFDIRSFAAITYDAGQKNEEDLAAVAIRALSKVKEALSIRGRQQIAAGSFIREVTPTVTAAYRVASMLAFDFEDTRREAEKRMGKKGCTSIDIQAKDTADFKGWHQVLRCACGDDILVVVDLNGEIVRTKIR
jgi:nucleoside 2-deoxyribosyltransferase